MATATSTTPVLDAYFERRDKFMKDNDLTDIFMGGQCLTPFLTINYCSIAVKQANSEC